MPCVEHRDTSGTYGKSVFSGSECSGIRLQRVDATHPSPLSTRCARNPSPSPGRPEASTPSVAKPPNSSRLPVQREGVATGLVR